MRPILRRAGYAVLTAATAMAVLIGTRTPSLDREWDSDVRVLAGVETTPDGAIRLTDVRDWTYSRDTVMARSYFDATFHPDDITELWFYEQQLDGYGLIAHTFVVFEFDVSYGQRRFLGLSVETRREAGEQYSLVGGALRSFEVTHIWATEHDLVTRRVEYLDYPLRRYRLEIPPEVRSRIFVRFARETAELAVAPQWYHTALNNCTSSLIRYVNESEPGAIPLHFSRVLTGRVDDHLRALGYLGTDPPLDVTRALLERSGLR